MLRVPLILITLLLSACSNGSVREGVHDFSKSIERRNYDRAAQIVSDICAGVYNRGLWIQRTRIEARREIRQSVKGRYGPLPPKDLPPALAEKIGDNTLNGTGPIVRIYCEGDEVPLHVWEELARGWRD
jgi:hypothetical protein